MRKIKLFALALMAIFSLSAMAETPSVTLTAATSVIGDWNKTYENVTISVTGAAFASKKPCGVSSNEQVMSISSSDSHWIEISCADGLNKIVVRGSGNSSGTTNYAAPLCVSASAPFDSTITNIYEVAYTGYDQECVDNEITLPEGTKSVRLYRRMKVSSDGKTVGSGSNWAPASATGNQTFHITYLEVYAAPACNEPTAGELSLSSNAPAALYEGTEVTISMAGGHGSGRSLTLDGETWMGYPTWTAVAGKHVIRVSEPLWEDTESGVTYCAGEDSVVLNVLAATPVTECTIAGEATGYIGSQITYTATAANATDYEWYVDGVAANTNSATFVYTANALGSHEIKATASNQYTLTPVESNLIALNVTQLHGELITYNVETGSGNIDKDFTVAVGEHNIIGGNGHQKTQKNAKLGSNGHYISLHLASGSFLEGDTVRVIIIPEYNSSKDTYSVPATIKISSDLDNTDIIGEATHGVTPTSADPIIVDIVISKDVETIYLSRNATVGQNPIVSSMAVIRPLDDGSPVLKASQTAIELAVTADNPNPSVVVNFSGKHLTPGSYSFGGGAVQNLVINPTSVTVDADGKLNQDVTFSYSNDADVAPYATIKNLTVDCEGGSKNVQVTITMSASHAIEYSSSINIEDSILDYGTKYGIAAALAAAKIQYENIDALDTLNDQKADRNEPYLGLKLKKSGAYIKVAVEAGKELNVRFGAHTAMVNVSINGTPIDGGVLVDIYDYSLPAAAEDRIVTFTTSSDATVVIKQIMVGEDLVDVLLPAQVMFVVNCVTSENGKVTASWEGKGSKDIAAAEGTIITLTVTPNDGFEIDQITAGNEVIVPVDGVYSYTFTMIGQNIDVIATFKAGATALDEAEEAVKAHKVVRDGHIVIIRGEKEFNAQGAQLR